ncbi:MAG: hypothetical protein LQ342_008183 [Letrouitia transgressa]|nr:MAG: hypothetical protein LQ342_008183 [Letrouitia transgressa]
MREVAGYLIHPKIPVDRPDIRVADVGTGTGIWACELATKLAKEARIDAFDISDAQYPAPAFRPENVHFYVHNSFQNYATEFQQQYDIVHARFLMCSVNDSNARSLLKAAPILINSNSWVENLKVLCEQAGLEDVSQSRHEWPDHLRPLWAQSSLASTADVLPKVDMWSTKEGGLTAKFIEDLQQEIAQGVAVDTPFQCVIGRKTR